MNLIDIITGVFLSLPGLTAGVLFATSWIKMQVNSNDIFTILISALVSLALASIGYLLQLGIFIGTGWYYIIIYGLAAMLMANGLSTWELIKALLVFLRLRVPPELKV